MKYIMIAILLLILIVGTLYIVSVTMINNADSVVRNAAADLDSMIAERYHIIKRILPILSEAGIEENETLNQNILIRIGMTVSEQKLAYTLMKDMEPVLTDLLQQNPALADDTDVKNMVESFINLEPQIAEVGKSYNNAVEKYNEVIVKFPMKVIAEHKKKFARNYFDPAL